MFHGSFTHSPVEGSLSSFQMSLLGVQPLCPVSYGCLCEPRFYCSGKMPKGALVGWYSSCMLNFKGNFFFFLTSLAFGGAPVFPSGHSWFCVCFFFLSLKTCSFGCAGYSLLSLVVTGGGPSLVMVCGFLLVASLEELGL